MNATLRPALLLVPVLCAAACSSVQPTSDAGSPLDAPLKTDAGQGDAAPPQADAAPSDAGVSQPEGGYYPDADTTPIAGLSPNTWQWVPLAGAKCMDGTATGIGVNLSPVDAGAGSKKLVIFLEGGGECMNASSCKGTPHTYGETNFMNDQGSPAQAGKDVNTLFDRSLTSNPLKDWNFVYVPYCTGDLHGGNNPGGHPTDVDGGQDYVGYVDVALALARLVPTFPDATTVLLTGISAGGAGVELNYFQTRQAFKASNPSAVVDAIDDSAPPMPVPYLQDCLQDYWATLYRYDRTVLEACGPACDVSSNTSTVAAQTMAKNFPGDRFGVIDSTDDGVISALYGYGSQACANITAKIPVPLDAGYFGAGQLATRAALSADPNWGFFLFPGKEHTTLRTAAYATRTSTATDGGMPLTTWVGNLVNGTVANVGPDGGT